MLELTLVALLIASADTTLGDENSTTLSVENVAGAFWLAADQGNPVTEFNFGPASPNNPSLLFLDFGIGPGFLMGCGFGYGRQETEEVFGADTALSQAEVQVRVGGLVSLGEKSALWIRGGGSVLWVRSAGALGGDSVNRYGWRVRADPRVTYSFLPMLAVSVGPTIFFTNLSNASDAISFGAESGLHLTF